MGTPENVDRPTFEPWEQALLAECRVAHLATIGANAQPRLVPVCYALHEGTLYTPVDEKPKRGGELARLRDIRRDPRVTLLFDRYAEDWRQLAWVRVEGVAEIHHEGAVAPGALAALRERYLQYRSMALESLPLVAVTPRRVVSWRWTAA